MIAETAMSTNGSSVRRRTGSLRHVLGRGVVGIGRLAGRSLFPLVTVIILGGTMLWGPWVTLVLGMVWFVAASLLA